MPLMTLPRPVGDLSTTPGTYRLAAGLHQRLMGFWLGFFFWALYVQGPGLIGERGLTPLSATLERATERLGGWAYFEAPSLLWISQEGWMLTLLPWLGLVASACLFVGLVPRIAAIASYLLVLSYSSSDFLENGNQWFDWPFDRCALEVTFLTIFLVPGGWWVPFSRMPSPPTPWRWLVLWMLFRVHFGPGMAKLQEGSDNWFELEAVGHFMETMPLPGLGAEWVAASPVWVWHAVTLGAMLVETLAPLLLLVPGRTRRWASLAILWLMGGILLTGNFRGFNYATIGLALFCWDDASLARLCRPLGRWVDRMAPWVRSPVRWRARAHALAAALLFVVTWGPFVHGFGVDLAEHSRLYRRLQRATRPLLLSHQYFMFHVVPEERRAIVFQGSDDGETWIDYEFIGAPSNIDASPRIFAPYQDYLGFMIWIGGLVDPKGKPAWVDRLVDGLLAGHEEIEALFRVVPFESPPRFVRAGLYRYAFSARENHGITDEVGRVWARAPIAYYVKPRSLEDGN